MTVIQSCRMALLGSALWLGLAAGAASAQTYTLVQGLDRFDGSAAAWHLLEKNGFVVSDPSFKQMFEPYLDDSIPFFITTDSAWLVSIRFYLVKDCGNWTWPTARERRISRPWHGTPAHRRFRGGLFPRCWIFLWHRRLCARPRQNGRCKPRKAGRRWKPCGNRRASSCRIHCVGGRCACWPLCRGRCRCIWGQPCVRRPGRLNSFGDRNSARGPEAQHEGAYAWRDEERRRAR